MKHENQRGNTPMEKAMAAILVAAVSVFLFSEILTFAIWAVPLLCLQVWQLSDLGVLASVPVGELTVTNITVMAMMWLLPCLFLLGIGLYLHCKLIKLAFRKLGQWIKLLRKGKEH